VRLFRPDVSQKVVHGKMSTDKIFQMLYRKPAKFLSAGIFLSTVKLSAEKRHERVVRKNVNRKSVDRRKISAEIFSVNRQAVCGERHEKIVGKNVCGEKCCHEKNCHEVVSNASNKNVERLNF
jgi:hypothetical protein